MTKLDIEDATSTFLYFGYTLIMVYLFFLLTGKYSLVTYCCDIITNMFKYFNNDNDFTQMLPQVQLVSLLASGLCVRSTVL